jgi:hypothetical protein
MGDVNECRKFSLKIGYAPCGDGQGQGLERVSVFFVGMTKVYMNLAALAAKRR